MTQARRGAFRYERRSQPLMPRSRFVLRVISHFMLACALVSVSLFIGMAGYAYYEHLSWVDAFLNAAMLLGGMGPVNPPMSHAGKVFAGAYALYAGLIFLIGAGIIIAPLFHRVIHRFHLEEDKG